jgi:hypothetical protein
MTFFVLLLAKCIISLESIKVAALWLSYIAERRTTFAT